MRSMTTPRQSTRPAPPPVFVRVTEAAARLNVRPDTFRVWAAKGELGPVRVVKVGTLDMVSSRALDAFIRSKD